MSDTLLHFAENMVLAPLPICSLMFAFTLKIILLKYLNACMGVSFYFSVLIKIENVLYMYFFKT